MREVHLFSRSFALNALERTSSHTPPRMTGDRKSRHRSCEENAKREKEKREKREKKREKKEMKEE